MHKLLLSAALRLTSNFSMLPSLLALAVLLLPFAAAWEVRAATGPDALAAPNTPAASADNAAYAAPSGITGPTTAFHDSVASRYNYAFGKESPFLPSNATSSNGQFLSPKSFYTAQYCGHCHQEAYHQWRQSVHANSFRAPWYLKNVNMLIDEKGVQYSRHCEGCHNPVALLSGDLSQGMPKKRPFEDEGVTCSTCHSIQSVDTTGTGSYVMGVPAVLVDEKGAPITGPVSDADVLSHLDRHSKAVMQAFLPHQRVLLRLPQSRHPPQPRRLQMAPRHLSLRRMAGSQLHQAVAAALLPQRHRLHLPNLPHDARAARPGRSRTRREGR